MQIFADNCANNADDNLLTSNNLRESASPLRSSVRNKKTKYKKEGASNFGTPSVFDKYKERLFDQAGEVRISKVFDEFPVDLSLCLVSRIQLDGFAEVVEQHAGIVCA